MLYNLLFFCLSLFLCLCPFSYSDSDMPDHDLEPPRFAQLALERVLQDWNALKCMIMFGSQENKDPYVVLLEALLNMLTNAYKIFNQSPCLF